MAKLKSQQTNKNSGPLYMSCFAEVLTEQKITLMAYQQGRICHLQVHTATQLLCGTEVKQRS